MSYDSKGYELAQAFIEDELSISCEGDAIQREQYTDDLAQQIQACIEDYIETMHKDLRGLTTPEAP